MNSNKSNPRPDLKCVPPDTLKAQPESQPAWYRERAARLQAAVFHLHEQRHRGVKFEDALADTLRRHPRRKLQSNPKHYAPLSRSSLLRFYYEFKRTGESAFKLRWAGRTPAISEGDTIAFLNYAVDRRSTRQLTALWKEFLQKGQRTPTRAPVPLLIDCPLKFFRRFQQRLAKLDTERSAA